MSALFAEMFPNDFNILPHVTAMGIAYLLAIPIGWDREKRDRSAGLRTFPLVALAACGFVQAVEPMMGDDPEAMSKIIEGLITGIGFIGGGAILRQGPNVRGTATAASLWATGAIGTAAGLGTYDVAVMLSVVTFLSFKLLSPASETLTASDDAPAHELPSDGQSAKIM